MTRPRKELVSIDATPYYHIVSRCVRRTFLCGYDRGTQTRYEHRRLLDDNGLKSVFDYCLITAIIACSGSVRLRCTFKSLSSRLVIKLDHTQAEP
jgi:hypothetical protein